MKHSSLKLKIKSLQADRLYVAVESISVIIISLFVSALLPSLLVRYVYANQQLFEQPKLLEIIPVAAFVISVSFAAYAIISNILRTIKIASLIKEYEKAALESMNDSCCGGSCEGCGSSDWADFDSLEELDKMVDEAIASSKTAPAKTAAKKSAKSVKKTAKKK